MLGKMEVSNGHLAKDVLEWDLNQLRQEFALKCDITKNISGISDFRSKLNSTGPLSKFNTT